MVSGDLIAGLRKLLAFVCCEVRVMLLDLSYLLGGVSFRGELHLSPHSFWAFALQ